MWNCIVTAIVFSVNQTGDFPSGTMSGSPARHAVDNTTIGTAISTLLATPSVKTYAETAPKRANSVEIGHLDGSSTHLDQ